MMRNTALILASCTLLIPVIPAQGQQDRQGGTRAASTELEPMSSREFRRLTVSGEDVKRNVERLTTEMRWSKTLSGALARGRSKGKPVLWIQALGDLKGFL